MVSTARPIRMRDRQPAGAQDIKDQAARLRDLLSDTPEDLSSAQALELMARVHGFRNWGHLAAHLRGDLTREPLATIKPPRIMGEADRVHGLSIREITDRLYYSAVSLGYDRNDLRRVSHLMSQFLYRKSGDRRPCDFYLPEILGDLRLVLPDITSIEEDILGKLTAQVLMEPPRATPFKTADRPTIASQPDIALQEAADLRFHLTHKPAHLAIIERDGATFSQVLEHYHDGPVILEAPFDAAPGSALISALSTLPGKVDPTGFHCAADFTFTAIQSAIYTEVLKGGTETKPKRNGANILHIPWRPHMTSGGIFLAMARSLGFHVVVSIPHADYDREAKKSLADILVNTPSRTLES